MLTCNGTGCDDWTTVSPRLAPTGLLQLRGRPQVPLHADLRPRNKRPQFCSVLFLFFLWAGDTDTVCVHDSRRRKVVPKFIKSTLFA
jgi:hypothetical protein